MKTNNKIKKITVVSKRAPSNPSGPPVAMPGVRKATMPRVSNTQNGITIRRREFVGTATNYNTINQFMVTPVSAATPGYDINPTCPSLFPWLSGVASSYERFRFNRLKFEFVPGQATTTAGRYYAAVDYDYDDAVATTKAVFMGNCTAVEAPVWQPVTMVCDPAALNRDMPYRYCSYTTRGLFVEARTMQSGYLMIGFDTPNIGCLVDIWVEYEVELVTPVLDEATVQNQPISVSPSTTAVTDTVGTAFGKGLPSTTPVVNGTLIKVTGATNGVPSFAISMGGTTKTLLDGIDMAMADYKGVVDLITNVSVTGVTPADILGTNLLSSPTNIFDDKGNHLGVVSSLPDTVSTAGPNVLSELSTASKPVRYLTSIALSTLRSYFPNARYLVPNIYSAVAALGAGYSSFGFRYSP